MIKGDGNSPLSRFVPLPSTLFIKRRRLTNEDDGNGTNLEKGELPSPLIIVHRCLIHKVGPWRVATSVRIG